MPLSIIGAGLGRTGTLSLKTALEQLGLKPCFHGLDGDRHALERVMGAVNRDPIAWDEVFQGYRAAVDVPTYWAYRELAEKYPAAKVILTVREPDAWFESTQALGRSFESVTFAAESLALRKSLRAKMLSGTFGAAVAQMARCEDRESRIAAYELHNAQVRESIPPDRLLVFDVREGWAPLCGFLGVPIPSTAFPRLNSRSVLPSLLQRVYGEDRASQPPAERTGSPA
jgi:Sulfotransferase domain